MLKDKDILITGGLIQISGGQKFVFVKDPKGIEIKFIEGLAYKYIKGA